MAKLLTQIQGRQALKQVMHSPLPSLTRYNVEPSKINALNFARETCQADVGILRLSNLYSLVEPNISGYAATSLKLGWSIKSFNYIARAHPWKVGFVIATTKAVVADAVAQKLIEGRDELDLRRSGLFFAFGAFYSGILSFGLYNMLYPAIFASRLPQLNALASVLADNLINVPFIFFPTLYLMKELILERTGSLKRVWNKYKTEVFEATVTGWKIWFPAHVVTFGLVPVHLRLPFVSIVSFFYYTIVSFQQTRFTMKEQQNELNLETH